MWIEARAATLVLVMFLAQAGAQPAAVEPSEEAAGSEQGAGGAEPTQGAPGTTGAGGEQPAEPFVPRESIPAGSAVSFPVDI